MDNFPNNTLPPLPKRKKSTPRIKIIGFFAILIIILAIPVTVFLAMNQQSIEQNASNQNTVPNLVCGNAPADIMLIFDRSDSMSQQNKIALAKQAAKNFIDIVAAQSPTSRIGLVSFAPNAIVDSPLTNNFSAVKTAVDNINLSFGTCVVCGVNKTNPIFASDTSINKKVAILLTDGKANWLDDPNERNLISTSVAEKATLDAIKNGPKFPYFTIGLGSGTQVNPQFLQQIATQSGGQFYLQPDPTQLQSVFQQISQIIGKGGISGTIFNDQNKNGILDNGEPPLSGWSVDLKNGSRTTSVSTTKSDASGNYAFSGLCDGTYTVSEQTQTGWTATIPLNPNYYTITIKNGDVHPNQNFGNTQATCGLSCTSNTDCSQAADSCTFCNPTTSKCTIPLSPTVTPVTSITPILSQSPTPSVCLTPGAIKNVKITCPNCVPSQ